MQLKRFSIFCIALLGFAATASAMDWSGNNMLILLGTTKNSSQFKEFKEYWQLNKQYTNPSKGIKVMVNDIFDRVDDILVAGESINVNGEQFSRCAAHMPFGISLSDDTSALIRKLGYGEKQLGKNAMRFWQRGVLIEVAYNVQKQGKITSIHFFKGPKPAVPEQKAVAKAQPVPVVDARQPVVKLASVSPSPAKGVSATSIGAKEISAVMTPFKRAVMDVFKASRESNFFSIKKGSRQDSNFWHYKYSYDTKLRIPGEKYNMVYSFPFASSPLDFVVVIKEADQFDKSFEDAYHQFEKQLYANFTKNDGWVGTCLPNPDKERLGDIEMRNDDYGSIILDYARNPKGQHVLYLRFLFYSN